MYITVNFVKNKQPKTTLLQLTPMHRKPLCGSDQPCLLVDRTSRSRLSSMNRSGFPSNQGGSKGPRSTTFSLSSPSPSARAWQRGAGQALPVRPLGAPLPKPPPKIFGAPKVPHVHPPASTGAESHSTTAYLLHLGRRGPRGGGRGPGTELVREMQAKVLHERLFLSAH